MDISATPVVRFPVISRCILHMAELKDLSRPVTKPSVRMPNFRALPIIKLAARSSPMGETKRTS